MHTRLDLHPDAGENRRLGSQLFKGVRTEYFISQDTIRLGGRKQTVDVLLGKGSLASWFAPFVHAELPGELAKLRNANEQQILDFAGTYGELGFSSLVKHPKEAFHYDPQTGVRSMAGDPLPWIRAHASGVYICLALTEALSASRKTAENLRRLLNGLNGTMYGDGADVFDVLIAWTGESPQEMAREWRRRIINANVHRVHRYISVDEKGKDRSFFGFRAPVDVIYWHLANVIDGGTVKRCEADGCGGIFVKTDPRMRYCPKRWRERESVCAMRQRQREARR